MICLLRKRDMEFLMEFVIFFADAKSDIAQLRRACKERSDGIARNERLWTPVVSCKERSDGIARNERLYRAKP